MMASEHLIIAQDNLRPNEFRLRSGQVKLMDDVRPTILESFDFRMEGFRRVQGLNKSKVESTDGQKLFYYVYFYQLGIRAAPIDEEFEKEFPDVESMLDIEADFDCEYVSEIEMPDEAIEAFGMQNVGFNVWPFWREYIQSTLNRVGVPHGLITLPFYQQARTKSEDGTGFNST